jgi:hypothetical protein
VNWLEIKFLRAAAALSAQSSRRLHSQSMAPHRGGTHQYESAVSPPSSEGSAPLNWLLFIDLRAAAAAALSALSSRRRLPQSMTQHRGALTSNTAPGVRPALKGSCR